MRPDDTELRDVDLDALDRAPALDDSEAAPERHAPGTAPTNPLERPANIRLRKTRPGSVHRRLFGEYFPARTRVRLRDESGVIVYDLPTRPDGTPDVERQRAGWHDDYAHRIRATDHRYKLIPSGRRRP